jgi:hypothetical protein
MMSNGNGRYRHRQLTEADLIPRPDKTEHAAKMGRRSPHADAPQYEFRSVSSILSAFSIFSVASTASILSISSLGSILSIGSSGSILSIGSVGSILSIGSAGSILSICSKGSILCVRSTGRGGRIAGEGANN